MTTKSRAIPFDPSLLVDGKLPEGYQLVYNGNTIFFRGVTTAGWPIHERGSMTVEAINPERCYLEPIQKTIEFKVAQLRYLDGSIRLCLITDWFSSVEQQDSFVRWLEPRELIDGKVVIE